MSSKGAFYARDLLFSLKIKEPPIDVYDIAEKQNITIKEIDAGETFDGCLMRCDDVVGILINKSIKYETRKIFTIAHELGHANIPHHTNPEYKCSSYDILFGGNQRDQEKEANEFAAELLIPDAFMENVVKDYPIDLSTIKYISETCKTSLLSSAIRYINYSPELTAIIVSEKNKIKTFFVSSEMLNQKLFFNKGSKLSKGTLAYDFFNENGEIEEASTESEEIETMYWLPDYDYDKYTCLENSTSLPNLNQVITLLFLTEKDD